jgi:hypothetical protein
MGDGNPALIVMVQEDERRKQWQFKIRDIKRENSNKRQQTTNGILYELSENNSKSDGYTNDTFDENGYINMKSLRNINVFLRVGIFYVWRWEMAILL